MSDYRRRAGISAFLVSFRAVGALTSLGLIVAIFFTPLQAVAQNLGPVINFVAPPTPASNPNATPSLNQVPVSIGETPTVINTGPLPPVLLVPNRGEVQVLKYDDQLRLGTPIPDSRSPTFTSSDEIEGVVNREMKLKGRAQIRRNGTVAKADEIIYDPDTDIAELIGNAEFLKNNTYFSGPRARFKVDAREGEMDTPYYEFRDTRGNGRANKLTIQSPDVFVFDKATYSTCSPENLDWYFSASRIEIDQDARVMYGKDGVMRFFDVPIAYIPAFSLPTGNQRRTGLLAPLIGYNSNNGLDISQPYYVNIAPNRDLILTPRYMNHRGTQLGANFRYIDPQYSGSLLGEYLNYDKILQRDRWKIDWQQRQLIQPGWNAYANVTKVSDNLYPIDFSYGIGGAVTNQFRQELGTTYTGIKDWNFSVRTLNFQTLQPDPTSTVTAPYNIVPQLTASYSNRSSLLANRANPNNTFLERTPELNLSLEQTRFSYNVNNLYAPPSQMPQGGVFSQADRTVMKGSVGSPIVTPGYYIKPKASFQANYYSATLVSNSTYTITPPNPPVKGFVLPTFSLDSGLAFEREASELKGFFGRDMLITVEPRAFYVFTPYQSQAQTPIFDTADQGFGITQIFSENTFVGNDRVADNNKLTMGLTSRMIEANTGAERASVTLAQRQDFTGQKVGLNNTITNPSKYSDTLGASTIRLMGNFNVDLFGQYNTQLNRFVQTSVGTTWRPTPGRSLSFAYRNLWSPPTSAGQSGITTTDQYNIFGEWPVTRKIRLLGRWGYDALTTKTLNTLGGLQYDEDCWSFRFAYSQALNTSTITTTQVLFQVEFRGFGAVGNNPVDVMKLNVPGYQPATKPLPPSIYENYQ
jgi:LPS-assembly protein